MCYHVKKKKSAFYFTESAIKRYDNPSFQHDESLGQSDQLKPKKKM